MTKLQECSSILENALNELDPKIYWSPEATAILDDVNSWIVQDWPVNMIWQLLAARAQEMDRHHPARHYLNRIAERICFQSLGIS